MKNPALLRLVLKFALFWLLPAALPAAAPATGTVEGRILNPRSGAVAEGARVSVEGTSLVAFTDADGVYRLGDVPAGEVRLRVFYTGIIQASHRRRKYKLYFKNKFPCLGFS